MTDSKALKDIFDRAAVQFVGQRLQNVHPRFPLRDFIRETIADLPALELKARAVRIAQGIRAGLPPQYPRALAIILEAVGPCAEPVPDGLESFRYLPFLNFVSLYGLDEPEISLPALGQLTRAFSAEFDIRPFLRDHPRRAMASMQAWSKDADWRVRRLASEGLRPRLPWGMRLPALIADPSPALPILHRLHADPNEIVRRSVANHLNDIAKDHADLAVSVAGDWVKSARNAATTRATIRHALRGLIKAGHPGALRLLGFSEGAKVRLRSLSLEKDVVRLGGHLEFAATIVNASGDDASFCIDYAVWHLRADGSQRPKVFKLTTRSLAPGEAFSVAKRHAIRPITTRRYYAGPHAVDLRVNGKSVGKLPFMLKT